MDVVLRMCKTSNNVTHLYLQQLRDWRGAIWEHVNTLLRSFRGNKIESIVNKHKESLSSCAVYHLDGDLEKLLQDFGNQFLKIVFVSEWNDLIIDDENLWRRLSKTNCLLLSRQKSKKAFGPIDHSINSVHTGIPLLRHMGHHCESTTKIIKANLQIIKQTNNPEKMNFDGTFLFCNCGCNEETLFYLSKKIGVQFAHTMKCRPALFYILEKWIIEQQLNNKTFWNQVQWLVWHSNEKRSLYVYHDAIYQSYTSQNWSFFDIYRNRYRLLRRL